MLFTESDLHNLIADPITNEISGVKLWNVLPGKSNVMKNREWEADLSEDQLKSLAYLFMDYVEKEIGSQTQ